MKIKSLILIIVLIMTLILVSCSDDDETTLTLLSDASELIVLPEQTSSDIELLNSISILGYTIDIVWTSSHIQYIANDGTINRPTFSQGNQSVTLTALFSYDNKTIEKEYQVVVLALPDVVANYTLTFNSNGGSVVADVVLASGALLTAPTAPTRSGYTFNGWYSDIGLTTAYTFTTMPANNLTLYAKWTINTYTITFNSNGGSAVSPIVGAAATAVSAPTVPIRSGYTFDGWYSDIGLTTAYTFTTMPANNLTLYAKWTINTYTITFNSNGGSAITAITQNFNTTVTVPTAPIRSGYTFDGWYSDIGLTTAYTFTTMPATNLTLYAKWDSLTHYDDIDEILVNEPNNVKVRGVIYYKYPLAMNPGFYLYDGTGFIYVLASTNFNVGDGVEFEAVFSYFEHTPQLTTITNLVANTDFLTMPTYTEVDLSTIAHADSDNTLYNGMPVIIEGFLDVHMMQYYLIAPFDSQPVLINFKSLQGITPDPFMGKLETRIQIHAIIQGYSPMQDAWHILYQSANPIVDINLTEAQKVAEILAKGVSEFDQKEFYSSDNLDLPNTDPFYASVIVFETFGENASLFNPLTGVFASTDVEKNISLRITVTIGIVTDTVEVTMILKPMVILSIADIKLLPFESYGFVSGVVILSYTEYDLFVIADNTGIIAVVSDTLPAYGDLVVVGGYYLSMDNLGILGSYEGSVYFDILDNNQEIPYAATPLSISNYLTLDPENINNWVIYVEMTGKVGFNYEMGGYVLENEFGQVPLVSMNMGDDNPLNNYHGFEVKVKGILVPNETDDEIPMLMIFFSGQPNDISFVLEGQALIDETALLLKEFIESMSYYPGQIIELPSEHPVILVTVSYTTLQTDDINLLTSTISDQIVTETTIMITATLTMGMLQKIIDIELVVVPMTILSIADFKLTDGLTSHITSGVVIFEQTHEQHKFYLIADATGSIYVSTQNEVIELGTEIIVSGFYIIHENMPFVDGKQTDPVLMIIAEDQMNPLIPISYVNLQDFLDLGVDVPTDFFKLYQLQGQLSKHMFAPMVYILESGSYYVAVYAPNEAAETILNLYIGYDVKVTGLGIPMGNESQMMIVFLSSDTDIEFLDSDEDMFDSIAFELTEYYNDLVLNQPFRPGAYHKLPEDVPGLFTYGYEVVINPTYYDPESGYFSNAISEYSSIVITVTLTVRSYTNTFNIEMDIEPFDVTVVDIDTFMQGELDTLYHVRGVVVFAQFSWDGGIMILADQNDFILIPYNLDLEIGDEVVLSGMLDTFMGVKTFKDTVVLYEVISSNTPLPVTYTPKTMSELALLDPTDTENWGIPIKLRAFVNVDQFYDYFLQETLSGGFEVKLNYLYDSSYDFYSKILGLEYFEVEIEGYLIPDLNNNVATGFMLFVAYQAYPKTIYTIEAEVLQAIKNMLDNKFSSQPFEARSFLEFTEYIDFFDAELEWNQITGPNFFHQEREYINDVMAPTAFRFDVLISFGQIVETYEVEIFVTPFEVLTIPSLSNTHIDDLIPGFYVHEEGFYYDSMFGSSTFEVQFKYPNPGTYGASYFILEYYDYADLTWKITIRNDLPVQSSIASEFSEADSIYLRNPALTKYRLRGYDSANQPMAILTNEAIVEGSSIHSNIISWSMDQSMWITGVMTPYYGSGIEVSAQVQEFNDFNVYDDSDHVFIYSWYRVNPYTFEKTLIIGETNSLYVTRYEDIGYYIMSRIDTDGIVADAYVQIISFDAVKILNPTYLLSQSSIGFVLEFSHFFNITDLDNMKVYHNWDDLLEITEILPTSNPHVFEFRVDLSDATYIELQLETTSWIMARPTPDGHMNQSISFHIR